MTIEKLIEKLAKVESSTILNNQYKNELQRKNLELYLKYFVENPPKCLFVGEAPSNLGGALTGIAFTDEYHLKHADRMNYVSLKGFNESNIVVEHRWKPSEEDAAGFMWKELVDNKFFPLLWNIVPFHTHEKENMESYRNPMSAEVDAYWYFVKDLLELFPSIKWVCAVGDVSFKALKCGGDSIKCVIYPTPIRQPVRGGAVTFREQVKAVAERLRQKGWL